MLIDCKAPSCQKKRAESFLKKPILSIFPLVQANCENCVLNIIPRELRFCMIFEKNEEISMILRYANFVSILFFGILYTVTLVGHGILTFHVPQHSVIN